MEHLENIYENKFISPLREQFLQFFKIKRTVGYKYREEERALGVLDKFLESTLAREGPVITRDIVRQYVTRWGHESDTTRSHRLSLIRQVCQFFALTESRTFIPPKRFLGIKRCKFTPRILTRAEAIRFVKACLSFPNAYSSPLRGIVLGTALLLLYLTGLRAGEALRLTLQDVNLGSGILHIRMTKFGKSRYVPMAVDLVERLSLCYHAIKKRLGERGPNAPFFCSSNGKPYSITGLRYAFHQVLINANIDWHGKDKRLRLHDLRHNAAVHRMILWYESGVDLETKLPLLSTYLGHKDLVGTQHYLHLTQELFTQIISRYQACFGNIINERS